MYINWILPLVYSAFILLIWQDVPYIGLYVIGLFWLSVIALTLGDIYRKIRE